LLRKRGEMDAERRQHLRKQASAFGGAAGEGEQVVRRKQRS
jgi:hypothetical protein